MALDGALFMPPKILLHLSVTTPMRIYAVHHEPKAEEMQLEVKLGAGLGVWSLRGSLEPAAVG